MKSSMMMAVAVCGVLAFAVSGCRYDDEGVNPDDLAVSTDVGTDGADVNKDAAGKDVATEGADANANGANVANAGSDIGNIQDENGIPATGVPFDQDPNYTRCTDVAFEPVYFGFDASNLAPAELAKIEAVATHLKQTGRVVLIEGNCDERGSNEYNLSLGEIRAIAIRDYLVTLGVDAQFVQTKSYGEEKPAVVGANEGAWSKNRRGEFAVFAKKQ